MQPQGPGCRERDARIAQLEQQVANLTEQLSRLATRLRELEARRDQNASNSSIPPSANPLPAPPPVRKQPTGRLPGGQPGRTAHLRARLPSQRLTAPIVHYLPDRCSACQDDLPAMPGPHDPQPRWHQIVQLPAVPVPVTEYQAHARTCPNCGHLNGAQVPNDIRDPVCGPRLSATVSFLSGVLHASRRGIEEFVETVLGVPIALGTVSNLEQAMRAAALAAHAEAQRAVQQASAKNVEDTGWKQAGGKRWLGGAATALLVCFVIAPSRTARGLVARLGQRIKGIVSSDRWSVYGRLKLGLRPLGWAHGKRDFQKLLDRGGEAGAYGERGLAAVPIRFHEGHLFRGGGSRAALQREWEPLREGMRSGLGQGARCGDAKAAALGGNLLAVEAALWTFVDKPGDEPTNNHVERLLRPGVLWRRNAFGSQSEGGCRLVERMLTVVQTLRLQQRPLLDFRYQPLSAHRRGCQAPRLLLER